VLAELELALRRIRRPIVTLLDVGTGAGDIPSRSRAAAARMGIELCSQLLHHFEHQSAITLLQELDRVARHRVIVSDLRRSWLAAAGIWLASFPLRFHPVSRHDGVVSVLRGFTGDELRQLVLAAARQTPSVRKHFVFRATASWTPGEAHR
jgi:hypothetical protein